MQALDFIHPEDAAALKALQAIPVLPAIMKKFMDVGAEQLQTGLNLASKIRLSPTQLPKLYKILPPICEELDIKEPAFYLEMNPTPNAYAFGDTQTNITITSALVEMMSQEELKAVVAHECGHIACHHMLYHSLAYILANATGIFEKLASLAVPIHYALMYWQRKSELSCDRVAAYVAGPQAAAGMLARLSGGPKSITAELNLAELAEQADEYDSFSKSDLWNKTLQTYAVLDCDHPFTSVRLREMLRWFHGQQKQIPGSLQPRQLGKRKTCPHCHRFVQVSWKYCEFCGKKL